jgi:hypothetical protein
VKLLFSTAMLKDCSVSRLQVEELMLTLKQAFQSAFQQSSDKDHVICELCPMHQMHKLCQQLESKFNGTSISILLRYFQTWIFSQMNFLFINHVMNEETGISRVV